MKYITTCRAVAPWRKRKPSHLSRSRSRCCSCVSGHSRAVAEGVSGFTLVELSIVIVIIGLIVAGVVTGQSLVKQARLSAVISDFKKYETAINTFKLQYNALPGDFKLASNYWTGAPNGDGNRQIRWENNENYYLWNHLSRASLVATYYDGTTGGFIAGVNMAPGAIKGSILEVTLTADYFDKYGNIMGLIGMSNAAMLKAVEAQNIDIKMDDGTPHLGRMVANVGGTQTPGTHCLSHAPSAPASTAVTWILTGTTPECRVYYFIDKVQ